MISLCLCFLQVLQLPPIVQKKQVRLIGDLIACRCECDLIVVCLYVSPVIGWRPVQGVPHPLTKIHWDRFRAPCNPLMFKSV